VCAWDQQLQFGKEEIALKRTSSPSGNSDAVLALYRGGTFPRFRILVIEELLCCSA
jgi:hypothetical protein